MAASLSGVWFRRAPVTGTARSSSTTANWALNPSCVSYPRMFRPVHESRMTAWPTLTVETPGPASTTIPRASLPGTCTDAVSPFPNTGTGRPSAAKFVLKLGPVARIATRTRFASFGFRRGAGTSSRRTDRDGGPYWSRWIVSASIRRGGEFPSTGERPSGQASSRGVNGTDMSESSGSLVKSGNLPAGRGVSLVRCAFPCRVFNGQTLFCPFPGKTGAGDNIPRSVSYIDPGRVSRIRWGSKRWDVRGGHPKDRPRRISSPTDSVSGTAGARNRALPAAERGKRPAGRTQGAA